MEVFLNYFNLIMEMSIDFAPKLLVAILITIAGLIGIKIVVAGINKSLKHAKIDVSLRRFFKSLIDAVLKIVLAVVVISYLGIKSTSFVAILAAAGFAIGMALQGSLSNFAGGVLILLFKPFKVGDTIDAMGFTGTVRKIEVFSTTLNTGDNKTIILPNGKLSNDSIVNYSIEKTRRVDMVFGIGYDSDIKKAKTILEKLIKDDERVLHNQKNLVAVGELAASSINFKVRVWVNSGDYWGVYHDFQEKVKAEFDKAKISIPFPQMDVHMKK